MVDLKSQYLKIKNEIDASIAKVIDSTAFINGPAVKSFQIALEDFLSIKHVIPCGNGTDALQIAMMALRLQPGDEVITSPFTFIATAEVISLLGLTPIFVDVYPDTYNLNIDLIEKAITPKTKAIIPVHLFGQCCDMEPLLALAQKYHLFVIEDACQAIGATYTFSSGTSKQAGTMGNIGCTSFFPSKNLGCYGDGGALFTNNDKLAHQMRGIVNHGMFTRYYHDMVGVNSRLDSVQAAILQVKLQHLNDYNAARQKAAYFYTQKLSKHDNIILPIQSTFSSHVYHQYTIQLKNVNRMDLIEKMKEKNIPLMIYYPVPLHLQKAFQNMGGKVGDYPISEQLSHTVLSLPMHTELSDEQLTYIVENFLYFIEKSTL